MNANLLAISSMSRIHKRGFANSFSSPQLPLLVSYLSSEVPDCMLTFSRTDYGFYCEFLLRCTNILHVSYVSDHHWEVFCSCIANGCGFEMFTFVNFAIGLEIPFVVYALFKRFNEGIFATDSKHAGRQLDET